MRAAAAFAALLLCAPAVAAVLVMPIGPKPAPPPGPLGPEQVPIPVAPLLAPASSPALGKSIDGIKCQRSEQVLFHIHAHLTIFVDGKARAIPFGIGIGPPLAGENTTAGAFVTSGSCFSWLHTHAADGIIHIESPVQRTYTLGEFFDIWSQPLSSTRVGPARGRVTVFVNGGSYTGNPREVALHSHTQIQLDVGSPLIAPESIKFLGGL